MAEWTTFPVGERIATHRVQRNLTQAELAQLVGISLSYLKQIEGGSRTIDSLSRLLDFAAALGVRNLADITGVPLPVGPNGHRMHPAAPGVRAALARTRVGDPPPDLDDLATRIEEAWTIHQQPSAWRYAQVGQRLPDLIDDMRTAVRRSEAGERRRALREAATLYGLARAWCKKVGELDLSMLCGDRAITYAVEADDPDLAAAAAWNVAQAISSRGLSEEAVQVAVEAIEEMRSRMDDPTPERLSAWGGLHLLAAVGTARDHDADGADRLLSKAELAARTTGERNDWRMVFGPTNVAIHRAAVAMDLSRPQDALRLAERVDVSQAGSVERRVSHHIDLARAYAARRDDVAATAMLTRVADESPEEVQHSVMVREVARVLLTRERPVFAPELRRIARLAGLIE